MWFLTALKVTAALAGAGGLAGMGVFLYDPNAIGVYYDLNIYGLTEIIPDEQPLLSPSPDTGSDPSSDTPVDPNEEDYTEIKFGKDKNYKCIITGIDEKSLVKCDISKIELDTSNKLTDKSDLEKESNSSEPDASTLKTKAHTIKVTVKLQDYGWDKIGKTIQVVSDNGGKITYAEITPIFAKIKDKILGEANHFFGAANSASTTHTASNVQCSFEQDPTTKVECEIQKVNSTAQTSSTEIKDVSSDAACTKETSTLTANNYYIIKITKDDFAFDLTQSPTLSITVTDKTTPANEVAKFETTYPAVFFETSVSAKNLVVLD